MASNGRRRTDRRFYEPRPSIAAPRPFLLTEALAFVRAASQCPGVLRIALVGSLTTDKPIPKDADLLITLEGDIDLEPLAKVARRLKGRANSINLGADIFLCDQDGRYFGRICGFRECHHRMACRAQHCGGRDHLNDDLHVVTLAGELCRSPPLTLWPRIDKRGVLPDDVERLLVAPLARDRPWLNQPGS